MDRYENTNWNIHRIEDRYIEVSHHYPIRTEASEKTARDIAFTAPGVLSAELVDVMHKQGAGLIYRFKVSR